MNIDGFGYTPGHDEASGDLGPHAPQNGDAFTLDAPPPIDGPDGTTTVPSPFIPTWVHPYETYPEPNLGLLGELPPEVFKLFVSVVPMADVAALGRVSRGMSAIVHSTSSPYAALLPLVEQAWTDDVALNHVVDMLVAIEAMPLPSRPEALRAVASVLMTRPKFPTRGSASDERWIDVLSRTGNLVYQEIDPKAQPEMLADLDIASWKVLFSCDMQMDAEGQFAKECWGRLQHIPTTLWPGVLDAAVSRSRGLKWLDVDAIVQDRAICFPCISDRLAVAFAETAELLVEGATLLSEMQSRFGITATQYAHLLRPMEALRLADLQQRSNVPFPQLWTIYQPSDPYLVALTEHVALEVAFSEFRKTGRTPVPSAFFSEYDDGDRALTGDAVPWNAKFIAFFSAMESAACHSAENTTQGDASATLLTKVFSKMIKDLEGADNFQRCLNGIFEQPTGFQPMLMDRWAEAFPSDSDNTGLIPLLQPISEWRKKVVDVFLSRNEPINAVRACVAELRTYIKITGGDHDAVGPVLESVTQQVFEAMPSESWGAMLSYLNVISPRWAGKASWVETATLRRWIEIYLKNPEATRTYDADKFLETLCYAAVPIFAELPDRDNDQGSKFDNFCDRFGIPFRRRVFAQHQLLYGVATTIATDAPHLRTEIRAALKKVEATDEASFLYVLSLLRR
jgi:hypothetical protein